MNANFGLIARSSELAALYSGHGGPKNEGDSGIFGIQGKSLVFPGIEAVEFEMYPITDFIGTKIPKDVDLSELQYAYIGAGLDPYEKFVQSDPDSTIVHPFESGLAALIGKLSFCAVMFAAERDRLETFGTVSLDEFLKLLRIHVADIPCSNGLLLNIGTE